jgi:RimJ/RimL family protein N-acetyltransferase
LVREQKLRTSRIILVPLLESDVSQEYLETLNDNEYMKYSRNSNFVHSMSSQLKYISDFRNSNNLLFAIKQIESEALLGNINCYLDFTKLTLNLGFLVLKNHHGQGYAAEALELLIPYFETQFPGMTLVIGSNKENIAMHRIARKLKFRLDSQHSQDDPASLRFIRDLPKLTSATIPSIPDFMQNAKKVGMVAHDAGGAEQLSWLMRNLPQRILGYFEGPAKRILENTGIPFDRVHDLGDLIGCDLLITGSGWMSDLEKTAIQDANERNVPCITVLDHWVNYLERFGEKELGQPMILAVTNSVALQIAQSKFPNKVVWFLPDFQIQNYVKTLSTIEESRRSLLILLEPLLNSGSSFSIGMKDVEVLLQAAIVMKRARGLGPIIVRLHPSQIDDYSIVESLKKYSNEIELSKSITLLGDLKDSIAVFGFSSYGLYISSVCGITSYSYFAGKAGHWTSNFPKILGVKV